MRRYYEFQGRKDPATLDAQHVTAFLNALANGGHVTASTQNQALAALLFLYRLCASTHKRGHINLAETQHYLTMTPDLLREAGPDAPRKPWHEQPGLMAFLKSL